MKCRKKASFALKADQITRNPSRRLNSLTVMGIYQGTPERKGKRRKESVHAVTYRSPKGQRSRRAGNISNMISRCWVCWTELVEHFAYFYAKWALQHQFPDCFTCPASLEYTFSSLTGCQIHLMMGCDFAPPWMVNFQEGVRQGKLFYM